MTCFAWSSRLAGLLMWVAILVLAATPARAASLTEIKARGKLVVGVKGDVVLWGFRDQASGQLVGLEPDLAQLLAEKIGVRLELVAVASNERIEALRDGRIDVLIATLSNTAERREQSTLVAPNYYSSGVNLLSRKEDKFRNWSELRNRRVCGRRGSFYNRPMTVQYGIDIVAFHSLFWAKQAVREGRCSALLYDDIAIVADLRETQWSRQFEMPMPTLYQTPWSVAIAKSEAREALDQLISASIIDWHREGTLVRLEKSWKIPPTDFVTKMNELWHRKDKDGAWYCGTSLTSGTPQDCLAPAEKQ